MFYSQFTVWRASNLDCLVNKDPVLVGLLQLEQASLYTMFLLPRMTDRRHLITDPPHLPPASLPTVTITRTILSELL